MDDNQGNNEPAATPEGGAASGEGGADAGSESTLSLEELNEQLGRDFKDKDSAVKALKDTFSFVGKAGSYQQAVKTLSEQLGTDENGVLDYLSKQAQVHQSPSQGEGQSGQEGGQNDQPNPNDYVSREQYERDLFYRDNPQYKGYESVIDAMATAQQKPPQEIVEQDDFKSIFDKAQAADEEANKKSVVESNQNLGASSDRLSKAKENLNNSAQQAQQGNVAEAAQGEQQARRDAVGAVMDAYGFGDEQKQ